MRLDNNKLFFKFIKLNRFSIIINKNTAQMNCSVLIMYKHKYDFYLMLTVNSERSVLFSSDKFILLFIIINLVNLYITQLLLSVINVTFLLFLHERELTLINILNTSRVFTPVCIVKPRGFAHDSFSRNQFTKVNDSETFLLLGLTSHMKCS